MLEGGKILEICSELGKYDITIAAIQETRWKGKGQINYKNHTLLFSGNDRQGQFGVAFIIANKIKDHILQFTPINERLAYIRVKASPRNLSILNVYAPTENAKNDEKERFYEEMEGELDKIAKEDIVIVLGDLNAQIGKEEYIAEVAGRHTIHNKTNNNGQRVCKLAAANNVIISSTKFEHLRQHKITWTSGDNSKCSQIDHVLITKRWETTIRDVRTYRGACADSDHYMVTATTKQKIKRKKMQKNKPDKWDIKKLNREQGREEYMEEIEINIRKNRTSNRQSVDEMWDRLKKNIIMTADEKLGKQKAEKKKEWYNEECKRLTERKVKARIKWIQTELKEDKEEYEKIKKECKKVRRKCKREWVGEMINDIEKDNTNKNTKSFYQKIKNQRKTNKINISSSLKDKNGKITESEEQCNKVWEEYFRELLNEAGENTQEENQEDNNDSEEEDEDIIGEPTIQEVKDVINACKNGKQPGKDGINGELLKYGGNTLIKQTHTLIKRIWREEIMPKDWELGQIVTIYKKGDPKECKNYRGITLLNTTYKILSTIIQKRLAKTTKNKIGHYQCGFVQGKSTTDAIHTLKQIIEKTHNAKINIEMLFIDFKQAFDSIRREKLMKALEELGIEAKLRRLTKMTMNNARVSIKTRTGETKEIKTTKGVRQGDALSATLFNIALEKVTKSINKNSIRNKGTQLIAYADDIVIIAKNRRLLKESLEEIVREGRDMGLEINKEKTKYMRFGKHNQCKQVKIGDYEFEEVKKFKYLGIIITNTGEREAEIAEKIFAANRALHLNKYLLKNKELSKVTKIKIYKTLIRPILLYGAETLTMTQREEEQLRIAERKIIRSILGGIKIGDDEYRIRMNTEILQELEGEDITRKIKQQRTKWLGHVMRADTETAISITLKWDPGYRRRGRPRSTWIKEVEEDLHKVGIDKWKEETKNRKQWNEICKKI